MTRHGRSLGTPWILKTQGLTPPLCGVGNGSPSSARLAPCASTLPNNATLRHSVQISERSPSLSLLGVRGNCSCVAVSSNDAWGGLGGNGLREGSYRRLRRLPRLHQSQ